MSTQHSSQLQSLQAQHSTELSQLTSRHQADAEHLEQQHTDSRMLLQQQYTSYLALQQEEHKLMMSQLATFLVWERDDAALELRTAHDAALGSLHTQHEQQLDAVQGTMLEQNVDALQIICASSDAAAESLVTCNAELTEGLSQLHSAQLEVLGLTFRSDVEHARQDYARVLDEMRADYQAKMAEANTNHEVAMNEAMILATQDSELAIQSQLTEAGICHAAELDMLSASHKEYLAEVRAQRERDQAESLRHLNQAMEQLTHEHAVRVNMIESLWADKQADQHELHQQQLLDLSMQHDSAVTDLTLHFQEQLEAAQAQCDEQLSQMSSEQVSTEAKLMHDAEAERQQHSVQLVNLQLQFEQTEHKLRAELSAVRAHAAADQQHQKLQTQIEVRRLHITTGLWCIIETLLYAMLNCCFTGLVTHMLCYLIAAHLNLASTGHAVRINVEQLQPLTHKK